MNIEQLAVQAGFVFDEGLVMLGFESDASATAKLEAFAKALQQQSEPVVGSLSEFAKQPIGKILKNGEIELYDTLDVLNQMVGFEIFIHPQHTVYNQRPNTVSLGQYNNLLVWTKLLGAEVEKLGITLTIEGKDIKQAISEGLI